MGAAVGQDCVLLEEVCGWINEKATVPVWAKMTPNITDITQVSFFFISLSQCLPRTWFMVRILLKGFELVKFLYCFNTSSSSRTTLNFY